MERSVRTIAAAPLAAALVCGLTTGCHSVGTVRFDDECRIPAERLEIHYVVDGYRGGYWSRALTLNPPPAEGSPVNELPDPTKGTTCQRAELHIVWPHSECAPENARAIIRLWHRGRPDPLRRPKVALGRPYGKFLSVMDRRLILPDEMEERDEQKPVAISPEIYTLDFARSELDLILPDLACGGYFTNQWRPNGGATLIVQVDRKRFQKDWTPEPRLDDLLTRVSDDGRRLLPVSPEDAPADLKAPADDKSDQKPGRTRLDDDADLPLPPLPSEDEPERTGRGSKRTPKPVKSDPEARPIPLPPEPEPSLTQPEPEPLTPPFEDTPSDDTLPPPLQSELEPPPKEPIPGPTFDDEP